MGAWPEPFSGVAMTSGKSVILGSTVPAACVPRPDNSVPENRDRPNIVRIALAKQRVKNSGKRFRKSLFE
jgi:hypothetical protein|tara:strand:+ start:533 stop:742 length:210 start_codon:yes stop_codon:yes gene_type:complete